MGLCSCTVFALFNYFRILYEACWLKVLSEIVNLQLVYYICCFYLHYHISFVFFQTNAAICDEVVRLENKVVRSKEERRLVLIQTFAIIFYFIILFKRPRLFSASLASRIKYLFNLFLSTQLYYWLAFHNSIIVTMLYTF